MRKNTEILLLILIVALGTFLRFYNLGEPSCFNDELETLRMANYSSLGEMMNEGIIPDVHPPAYQILMYFVVHNIGDSEFCLRFPSAIAGILAILMIYFLGKYLYSSKEGLISAAIVAILWAPLYFSQEGRAYSFLFLFSIIATYYWLKIINVSKQNGEPKRKWIIIYIISAILLLYMQYLGLFLIILQGLSALIILKLNKNILLRLLFIYGIIAIALLPWLPFALEQVSVGVEWVKKPNILAFGYFLAFLFNLSPWVLALVTIVFVFWLVDTFKNGLYKNDFFISQDIFLLLWLFVPITIIYIKSILSNPVLTYYSLMISAPAAYILLARGISMIKTKSKYSYLLCVSIIAFLLIDLLLEVDYYGQPYKNNVEVFGKNFKIRSKQMFREAAHYVKSFDSKYPNSIIVGYAWFPYYFNYYFKQIGFDRTVDIHVLTASDTTKFLNIKEQFPDKEFIWILRGHKEYDSVYVDWMKNKFKLIHHEPMIGADVWLYKIRE
jgi:mannosyltransferase